MQAIQTKFYVNDSHSLRTVQRHIKGLEDRYGTEVTFKGGRLSFVKPEFHELLMRSLEGRPLPEEMGVLAEDEVTAVEIVPVEVETHEMQLRSNHTVEVPSLPALKVRGVEQLQNSYDTNLNVLGQATDAVKQTVEAMAEADGEELKATYKAALTKKLAEGKLELLQELLGGS